MEKTHTQIKPHSSIGDAAVSGLFGGLLGGLAMALVIILFSLFAGQGLSYMGYFSTATPVPPLQGLLMHLAVSAIYGMLFSLILHGLKVDRLNLPGWLVGTRVRPGLVGSCDHSHAASGSFAAADLALGSLFQRARGLRPGAGADAPAVILTADHIFILVQFPAGTIAVNDLYDLSAGISNHKIDHQFWNY